MTSPKRPGRSGPARRKPGAKSASTKSASTQAKSAPRAAGKPRPASRSSSKPGRSGKPARNVAVARAAKSAAPALPPLVKLVLAALDDMKAQDVRTLDVRGLTDIADTMIIASGTSDRHVKSIADRVVQQSKAAGKRPFGVEGERDGEWVLVDLPDVMVHVMLPRVREFYALEQLWEPARSAPAAGKSGGRPIAT
jgi:ribosome-associated protein